MSEPPMTLKTIPVAFSMGASRRGEEMAREAASAARPLPVPDPMPMRADPASPMTDLTSAKSTLMMPGLTMISEMPTTPCLRISSATAKARSTGVSSGMISRSLSLDTTMMVSTLFLSSSIASLAWFILLLPSKLNGLVTMATVRAPDSLAISATTGAAPDPVPPPIPLVTKHKSAPDTIADTSCRLSSAACRPTTGRPPAPRPRVTSIPMFRTWAPRALERPRAWASVFTAQNSTPSTRVSSMRSTALDPPPPTPITLITHGDRPPSGITAAAPEAEAEESRETPRKARVPREADMWREGRTVV
mmetsp:Transcript_21995/g.50159  ORF Transcript_21995/g.50159 Transcript_21995/m.50159 type:complete len:305 (-) Transcript_21995:118-1032(-)